MIFKQTVISNRSTPKNKRRKNKPISLDSKNYGDEINYRQEIKFEALK